MTTARTLTITIAITVLGLGCSSTNGPSEEPAVAVQELKQKAEKKVQCACTATCTHPNLPNVTMPQQVIDGCTQSDWFEGVVFPPPFFNPCPPTYNGGGTYYACVTLGTVK